MQPGFAPVCPCQTRRRVRRVGVPSLRAACIQLHRHVGANGPGRSGGAPGIVFARLVSAQRRRPDYPPALGPSHRVDVGRQLSVLAGVTCRISEGGLHLPALYTAVMRNSKLCVRVNSTFPGSMTMVFLLTVMYCRSQ